MKRKLAAIVLLVMLMTAALAETTYYGTMMVDNCDEWVSLRDGPGTGCGRLAKVPLYAIVTDCEKSEWTGDFIYCNYDGQWGYILAKYLTPWADPEPEEGYALDVTMYGYRVMAKKTPSGDGEYMRLVCEDPQGQQWVVLTEHLLQVKRWEVARKELLSWAKSPSAPLHQPVTH